MWRGVAYGHSILLPVNVNLENPDQRVVMLKKFGKAGFPSTPYLDFALEVEKVCASSTFAS